MGLGVEAMRTPVLYNMDLLDGIPLTGDGDGMPVLRPADYKPDRLIGFNAARTAKGDVSSAGLHFFIDDYQFQRVWNRPRDYVRLLKRFGCVLTPDFSLYRDMPLPLQVWNVYRSRLLGAWWQRQGITVIPTLQWSTPETYSFRSDTSFVWDGLPDHSTVAVSTLGVLNDAKAMDFWRDGMMTALAALHPTRVLLYGRPMPGFEWPGTEVVRFSNDVVGRMDANHKEKARLQAQGSNHAGR